MTNNHLKAKLRTLIKELEFRESSASGVKNAELASYYKTTKDAMLWLIPKVESDVAFSSSFET